MSKKQDYEVVEMAIDAIKPSPDNPRKTFDVPDLEALKGSIEERGLTEPILVRRADHTIIKGERRYRAEKLAGAKTLPVRVYDVDELTAGEMRLQGEAETPDREYEEGLAKQFNAGFEVGRYKSAVHFARVIGQSESTVGQILKVHKQRENLASEDKVAVQEVTWRDLEATTQLAKKDPEARIELLKHRNEITQREMQKISIQAANEEEDIRRQLAKREITFEDALETEVLEDTAPEARRSLLAQRQAGTIDFKELTARVAAIQEVPEDIRTKIAEREITPEDAKDAAVFETPQEREYFLKEREMIRSSQEQEIVRSREIRVRNADDVKAGRPPTFVDVDLSERHRNEQKVDQCQKTFFRVWEGFSADLVRSVTDVKMRRECIEYIQKTADFCLKVLDQVGEVIEIGEAAM